MLGIMLRLPDLRFTKGDRERACVAVARGLAARRVALGGVIPTAIAFIRLASIRLMLRRFTRYCYPS